MTTLITAPDTARTSARTAGEPRPDPARRPSPSAAVSFAELESLLAETAGAIPGPDGDDGGLDACTAMVIDDDWMVRRQVGWVLGHAGVEVVLDMTAPAGRFEQAVLAGLGAAPAVVVVGDIAGCDLDRLLDAVGERSPETDVIVYRRDEPFDLASRGAVWVAKPDLQTLERAVRPSVGTD